jgi:hypothetical protein
MSSGDPRQICPSPVMFFISADSRRFCNCFRILLQAATAT